MEEGGGEVDARRVMGRVKGRIREVEGAARAALNGEFEGNRMFRKVRQKRDGKELRGLIISCEVDRWVLPKAKPRWSYVTARSLVSQKFVESSGKM